jgi:putative selenium metabolism hydrolase
MKFDDKFQRAAEPIKDRVTRFLVDLIERPSLSRDEDSTAQRIGDEMQSVGFDEVMIDGFGSAIGRIGNGPVHIVFDSHIDVVDTGDLGLWKSDPFKARIDDGILYGRGASDNKAAIASMVHGAGLLRQLDVDTSRFTLWVVGTVQEEDCDGLALEYLLKNTIPKAEVVVLGEATAAAPSSRSTPRAKRRTHRLRSAA